MSGDSEHDSKVGRVTEEIRRILAMGEEVKPRELASRFGLRWTEVERCARAVRALAAAAPEPATAPPEHARELPLPPLPADYELLGELGRGGMAVVYRARQRSLGRVVAVKVLRPGDLVFGAMQRRFLHEARALARLRHPHIVNVHEVGETAGNVFFSMDLIEGESLADAIRAGGMTPTRAVRLLRQVASAIAYSHANGLVHRDLKPGNILVDRGGDAYVVDFGLARDLSAAAGEMTGTGQLLGTPAYMSPEQARGDSQRIGEATDVYALGAVLYECLTGRPPFGSGPMIDTIRAVVNDDPVPPRKIDPKVPADLEIVCAKAMAKEPERRYANAQAFLEDLERFAEGREIRARPPSRVYRARKFVARHRAAALAAACTGAAAAVVLSVTLATTRTNPERVRFDDAADAFEKKDHAFAASACDDALKRYADNPALWAQEDDSSFALEYMALGAKARVELVRATYDAGHFADAARDAKAALDWVEKVILRQFESNGGRGVSVPELSNSVPELKWLRAVAAARARLTAEARDGVASIGGGHYSCWNGEKTRRFDADGFRADLARVESLFASANPEDHAAAVRIFAEMLWFDDLRSPAASWIGGRPAGAVIAGDLLRALPTFSADEAERTTRTAVIAGGIARAFEALGVVRPRECLGALAAIAADASAPEVSRAVAADLLAVLDDLPVATHGPDGVPGFDEVRIGRILDLRRELRTMRRADALRRSIELAQEQPSLAGWIAAHTGNAPDGDPRTALLRAAGLPETTTRGDLVRTLLQGYADAGPDDPRRAWLHALLRLSAPDSVEPPAWSPGRTGIGGVGASEPPGLALAWRDALPADAPADRFRVRMAVLILDEGGEEPRIAWQAGLPLRVGESARVGSREAVVARVGLGPMPLRAPGESTRWLHFPWPNGAPFDLDAVLDEFEFWPEMSASLAYGPAGVDFAWENHDYPWHLQRDRTWATGGGRENGRFSVDSGPVRAFGYELAWRAAMPGAATDARSIRYVSAALYEPESADPAPWTWAQWRAALDGTAVAPHLSALPPREEHWVSGLGLCGLLMGAALFAAYRAVRTGSAGRLVPACALVLLGFAISSNHVELGGLDLRVELGGLAFTLTGLTILAAAAWRDGRRRVAVAAPPLFAISSGACAAIGEAGVPLFLVFGLGSVVWTAAALTGLRRPWGLPAFLVLWPGVPIALGFMVKSPWLAVITSVWLAAMLAWLVVAVRRRTTAPAGSSGRVA